MRFPCNVPHGHRIIADKEPCLTCECETGNTNNDTKYGINCPL